MRSYSLPSRSIKNPCRTLALSQRLEFCERSPTSTSVGCADVITCSLGGCAQGIAISVHFFGIERDVEYAWVLVHNGNASFPGVMQTFLGTLYIGMGAGQALADLSNITKAKNVPPTCSASRTANLWRMGWNLLGECPCHCWRTQREPRQMYGHASSLQRHTLDDTVLSGFRVSHTG